MNHRPQTDLVSSVVARPSVQFISGASLSADETAARYFDWVERRLPGVTVRRGSGQVVLELIGVGDVIELRPVQLDSAVAAYQVVGGALVAAEPGGEFRFERVGDGVRVALSGFRPRLPLLLYRATHAVAHWLVMSAFCRVANRQLESRNVQ